MNAFSSIAHSMRITPSLLRVSRTPAVYDSVHSLARVRFASTASSASKASQIPKPLEYKGRIPKPEPIKEFEPIEEVPPTPKSPEPTKEELYKRTYNRVLRVICLLPVVFVTSYYLYRRLFLGEKQKSLTAVREVTE